ncbi:MAG: hypothetical protein A2139_04425 [Desulfobacca sp. RBG_16_60_12]|nr:MAG: hypothetical protein A2139_04425 [Desulfobacca sp. RBG_16_60_12]
MDGRSMNRRPWVSGPARHQDSARRWKNRRLRQWVMGGCAPNRAIHKFQIMRRVEDDKGIVVHQPAAPKEPEPSLRQKFSFGYFIPIPDLFLNNSTPIAAIFTLAVAVTATVRARA